MHAEALARKLYAALAHLKRQGLLNEQSWVECATEIIAGAIPEPATSLFPDMEAKTPPRAPKVSREERNALFEAIVRAVGDRADEITKPRASEITEAIKHILKATPDLTPEAIARRAAKFREKHPTWALTPSSLAKWWPQLSAPVEVDVYREPPGDWRAVAVRIAGPEYAEASWETLRPAYGRRIWQAMAA